LDGDGAVRCLVRERGHPLPDLRAAMGLVVQCEKKRVQSGSIVSRTLTSSVPAPVERRCKCSSEIPFWQIVRERIGLQSTPIRLITSPRRDQLHRRTEKPRGRRGPGMHCQAPGGPRGNVPTPISIPGVRAWYSPGFVQGFGMAGGAVLRITCEWI